MPKASAPGNMSTTELSRSFCFVAAFRRSYLGSGGNLVACRSIRMLTMLLEILITVVITIRMIVSMLLRSILMHLLRTRSKLIRSAIPAHGHLSGWLLRVHGCDILRSWAHTRIHPVHGLLMALLRTLIHHHWCTSSWAWETIGWHGGWAVMRWHKRALSSLLVHHLGPRGHALGSQE